MYLTNEQFDKLRSWAQQTRQIEEAYLFGSYAKGEAHGGSDVDVAIKASASNWADLIATWQKQLTQQLGVRVSIRTLANPKIRKYCHAHGVRLKR